MYRKSWDAGLRRTRSLNSFYSWQNTERAFTAYNTNWPSTELILRFWWYPSEKTSDHISCWCTKLAVFLTLFSINSRNFHKKSKKVPYKCFAGSNLVVSSAISESIITKNVFHWKFVSSSMSWFLLSPLSESTVRRTFCGSKPAEMLIVSCNVEATNLHPF